MGPIGTELTEQAAAAGPQHGDHLGKAMESILGPDKGQQA